MCGTRVNDYPLATLIERSTTSNHTEVKLEFTSAFKDVFHFVTKRKEEEAINMTLKHSGTKMFAAVYILIREGSARHVTDRKFTLAGP